MAVDILDVHKTLLESVRTPRLLCGVDSDPVGHSAECDGLFCSSFPLSLV